VGARDAAVNGHQLAPAQVIPLEEWGLHWSAALGHPRERRPTEDLDDPSSLPDSPIHATA
jgi:hypothetical protein